MAPRVGVFHPGTQHSWQTALAFQEAQQLGWYATSIFYQPERWPYRVEKLLPSRLAEPLHRRFMRRFTPILDASRIRQFGLSEWVGCTAGALQWSAAAERFRHLTSQWFGRHVIAQIEREPVDVIWGYDTSALRAFRWAKPRGIRCILDRTTIHGTFGNRIAAEEFSRHPEFFSGRWTPKAQWLIDDEDEEIALADIVVVGSAHCADTLVENGCPRDKIRIINYGFDERSFPDTQPIREPVGRRALRFLYVGNLKAQKGIAYLLKAFAKLPPDLASLTLVGGLAMPSRTFATYADRVNYVSTVPRSEVIAHYAAADCFVFPSLIEGSAIVLREIAGAGLGGIQTRAGGDGVLPGISGRLIAPGSVEAIVDAVMALVDDPEQIDRWCDAAWSTRNDNTGTRYRAGVRDLVRSLTA